MAATDTSVWFSEPLLPQAELDVLLVAGPSGSGKSTFIEALFNEELPAELCDWLPNGASDWPAIEANDVLKRGYAAGLSDLAEAEGVICHYDTFFALRYGLEDYTEDPIWPLFEHARSLRIVSIEPTPTQLRAQFAERFRQQMRNKGTLRSAWHQFGNMPIKRIKHRLTGKGMPDSASFYRNADIVETCYGKWSECLDELCDSKANAKIVRLVPFRSPDGAYGFSKKAIASLERANSQ